MPLSDSCHRSCSIHKAQSYIFRLGINFEYVKCGHMLQGEGEWHRVLTAALLSLRATTRVKEDATGVSRYWRPLPVKLEETDSNTHGTQCTRKESHRERWGLCVCYPRTVIPIFSFKVSSLQFKERSASSRNGFSHRKCHINSVPVSK